MWWCCQSQGGLRDLAWTPMVWLLTTQSAIISGICQDSRKTRNESISLLFLAIDVHEVCISPDPGNVGPTARTLQPSHPLHLHPHHHAGQIHAWNYGKLPGSSSYNFVQTCISKNSFHHIYLFIVFLIDQNTRKTYITSS